MGVWREALKEFLLFPFNFLFALFYALLFFIIGSIIWSCSCVLIAVTLFYGLIESSYDMFMKILYGKQDDTVEM